jgi:hypothetical protein
VKQPEEIPSKEVWSQTHVDDTSAVRSVDTLGIGREGEGEERGEEEEERGEEEEERGEEEEDQEARGREGKGGGREGGERKRK